MKQIEIKLSQTLKIGVFSLMAFLSTNISYSQDFGADLVSSYVWRGTQFGSGAHQPNLDTEIFDLNADFASNTFTAPVTGKYFLSWMVYAANLDTSASYYYNLISTSNRNYYKYLFTASFASDVAYYGWSVTAFTDMDANDTAKFYLGQNNGHSTSQIYAADTRAMGFLVC